MPQKKAKMQKLEVAFSVLKTVAALGLVSAALVAPNVAQLIPYVLNIDEKRRTYVLSRAAKRLQQRGLIKLIRRNGKVFYTITEEGHDVLNRFLLRRATIPQPKRWDEKWRIILFDVREERKQRRDAIRIALRRLGFVRLQDSVWIYPFECEEILELLRTAYGVRHDALYLTAGRFPQDRWLLEEFNLRGS